MEHIVKDTVVAVVVTDVTMLPGSLVVDIYDSVRNSKLYCHRCRYLVYLVILTRIS